MRVFAILMLVSESSQLSAEPVDLFADVLSTGEAALVKPLQIQGLWINSPQKSEIAEMALKVLLNPLKLLK